METQAKTGLCQSKASKSFNCIESAIPFRCEGGKIQISPQLLPISNDFIQIPKCGMRTLSRQVPILKECYVQKILQSPDGMLPIRNGSGLYQVFS